MNQPTPMPEEPHNPPSAGIESPSQSGKATRRSSCTPWMYTAFYYPSAFRHLLPTVGIAPKSTDLRNAPTENPRRIRRIPSLGHSLRRLLTRPFDTKSVALFASVRGSCPLGLVVRVCAPAPKTISLVQPTMPRLISLAAYIAPPSPANPRVLTRGTSPPLHSHLAPTASQPSL